MWKFITNLFRKGIKLPPNTWDFYNERKDEKDAMFGDIFGAGDYALDTPSRDWRTVAPLHEIQSGVDCVSFSRTNCAEAKAIDMGVVDDDGNEFNFSDLDLSVGSGTGPNGNGMKPVSEYGRKTGISLEKDCPYTRSQDQAVRRSVFETARDKKKYKLGNWSWVTDNLSILKQAMETSPLQIGVGLGSSYSTKAGTVEDPVIDTGQSSYKCYHAMSLLYIDANGHYHCLDHYNRRFVVLAKGYALLYVMSFADLPQDWRGKTSDDSLFYKRMVGKCILRPHSVEDPGIAYRVYEDKMAKISIFISDPEWKELYTKVTLKELVKAGKLIGVSEADFERLKKVAYTVGKGIVEEEIKGNLDFNELNN